jgi:hypothetical protein
MNRNLFVLVVVVSTCRIDVWLIMNGDCMGRQTIVFQDISRHSSGAAQTDYEKSHSLVYVAACFDSITTL